MIGLQLIYLIIHKSGQYPHKALQIREEILIWLQKECLIPTLVHQCKRTTRKAKSQKIKSDLRLQKKRNKLLQI